jgi:hypothetical protein
MKQVTDVRDLSNRQLVSYAVHVANKRGIGSKREFKLREPIIDEELAKRSIRGKVVLAEIRL